MSSESFAKTVQRDTELSVPLDGIEPFLLSLHGRENLRERKGDPAASCSRSKVDPCTPVHDPSQYYEFCKRETQKEKREREHS